MTYNHDIIHDREQAYREASTCINIQYSDLYATCMTYVNAFLIINQSHSKREMSNSSLMFDRAYHTRATTVSLVQRRSALYPVSHAS